MVNQIQSVQNLRVKQWAQLLERRGRQKFGQYIVEGLHLVEEAIRAKTSISNIVYQTGMEIPEDLFEEAGEHMEWIEASAEVIAKCTDTETPQGLFAVVNKPDVEADRIFEMYDDLVIVVDGVQDPGNLGTIIRCADAVGASGVMLGKGTVDLYNPKTIRSTMGSIFHLPIVECDLPQILSSARNKEIQLVCTSLQSSESCYNIDFRKPTWIIVGNEGQGVSPVVSALASHQVIIPMQGQSESLNVAMAATVLLFEASRQRLYPSAIIPEL